MTVFSWAKNLTIHLVISWPPGDPPVCQDLRRREVFWMFPAPQTPLRTYPHPSHLSQIKKMELKRGFSFKSRVTTKWPNSITLVTRLKQPRALGLTQKLPQRKHLPSLEPLLKPIKRFSNRGRRRKRSDQPKFSIRWGRTAQSSVCSPIPKPIPKCSAFHLCSNNFGSKENSHDSCWEAEGLSS